MTALISAADPKPADPEPAPAPAGASEITLWTYPIGDWGTEATVKTLTDAFTAETGIAVKVEYYGITQKLFRFLGDLIP